MSASALLALARGVRSYLATVVGEGAPLVLVGWTARSRQDSANRIVFVPGEVDGSAGPPKPLRAGRIDRDGVQMHVSDNPSRRALAWWHEPVTVFVWASPAGDPQDEEGQIGATEDLLELVVQALHNAVDPDTQSNVGFADIEEWGQPSWTTPPGEASFGKELAFTFVLTVPLFDQPVSLAFPRPSVARPGQ